MYSPTTVTRNNVVAIQKLFLAWLVEVEFITYGEGCKVK